VAASCAKKENKASAGVKLAHIINSINQHIKPLSYYGIRLSTSAGNSQLIMGVPHG
jgi:hypothetical protein